MLIFQAEKLKNNDLMSESKALNNELNSCKNKLEVARTEREVALNKLRMEAAGSRSSLECQVDRLNALLKGN